MSIYYRLNNDNMQEVMKHLNSMVNVQVAELEGCQPNDHLSFCPMKEGV